MVDENQREDYIAFVEESIEIAKFLKCHNLVIHSNALDENGIVKNHYRNIYASKTVTVMFDVLKTLKPSAPNWYCALSTVIVLLPPSVRSVPEICASITVFPKF